MGYFLFFFYLFLLSWLLTRIKFVKKAGLKAGMVVVLFLIKIMAGVFSGWMVRQDLNSDTWGYHKDALTEYHLLFTNPSEYFTNLFFTGYQYGYQGIFQFHNSYWNDLKTNLMIKFVSILHIFSFGHYYVNVILYNFIVFFGHIALFRVFSSVYKNQDRVLIITCFLLPSFLLFSSTLHKEGLIFAAISITAYCFYTLMNSRIFVKRKVILIVLLMTVIFLFRSYVFIILIPALFAWFISYRKKYSPVIVFSLVFIVSSFIFFINPYFLPSINLPQLVVQKQLDFLSLEKANTFIEVNPLKANFESFLYNIPQALNHSLLRPSVSDYKLSLPLIPFIGEWMLYQMLFILFLFFRNKGKPQNLFVLFGVFLSVFILLIIGYTVPVLWAIIRYRSIYLPFFLTPLICSIDYNKAKAFIQINK